MSDEQELTELLGNEPVMPVANRPRTQYAPPEVMPVPVDPVCSAQAARKLVQWTTDDTRFIPAGRTVATIKPGLYEIQHEGSIGIFFRSVPINTTGLLRLPHTNSDLVVHEIQSFWSRKEKFALYELPFKRGILLWGPPGSGKSCTVQLVMKDVIDRGGLGVVFTHPGLFAEGMRMLREIQPDTPIVVLMEDLDSIVASFSESEVLNLLDGAERVDGIVFLATTNYPELLGSRVVNRPSRFDRRIKIGHPSAESRALYLRHIIRGDGKDIDIERWVADTEGLSLAHVKELLVSVAILGCDYSETVERLRGMRENITSTSDRQRAGLIGKMAAEAHAARAGLGGMHGGLQVSTGRG